MFCPPTFDYYLIHDQVLEYLKVSSKINLKVFNYYNHIRTGFITREDVIEKYCDFYAYNYENKEEGFRIKIRNKSDIDSIDILFPYKANIDDSSKIFKNYDVIPLKAQVDDDLYKVIYWYYCGGFYHFTFLFKNDSIELENVKIERIGLTGKECMLL